MFFNFNTKSRLLISGVLFALGIFIIVLIELGPLWRSEPQEVRAAASDKVRGWGWSENIGWVSMNCYNDFDNDGAFNCCCSGGPGGGYCPSDAQTCPYTLDCPSGTCDYGVYYNTTDNKLTGWAWSDRIGWICFGETCNTICLGGTNNGQTCVSDGNCSGGVCGGKPPHSRAKSWACIGGPTWTCVGGSNNGQSCGNTCPGGVCEFSCSGDAGEDFVDTGNCIASGGSRHLMAHWKINSIGSGGIISDEVGYNTGTLMPDYANNDAPIQAKGKWINALKFDGTNDYIEVADSTDLSVTGNLTVEAWVKRGSIGAEQTVVGKWNESNNKKSYRLWFDINNRLNFSVTDGTNEATITQNDGLCIGGTSTGGSCLTDANCLTGEVCKNPPIINTKKWYHLVGKYVATTSSVSKSLKIYIDGYFIPSNLTGTIPDSLTNLNQKLYLGAKKGATVMDTYFKGIIDNLAIWSCANSGRVHGRSTKDIWDDAHKELDGWARVINLAERGWLKLKGFTKAGRVWGSYLKDYGTFYIFSGYLANRYVDESMSSNGLVAQWKMNEPLWDGTSSEVIDSASGNLNSGTSYGTTGGVATTTTKGIFNSAGDFDGVDDYIDGGNNASLSITGDVTLEAWINMNAIVSGSPLLSFMASGETSDTNVFYVIEIASTGDIKLGHEYGAGVDQFTTIDTNLVTEQWYHLAVVRDDTAKTWKLFVNGVQSGSTYTYTNSADGGSSNRLNIGYNPSGPGYYFDGRIDNVAIYNRAKIASEIQSDYEKRIPYCAGWGDYEEDDDPPAPLSFNTLIVNNTQGCEQLLVTWDESTWAESYTYWRKQANNESLCGACTGESECETNNYTENSVLEGEECYLQDTDVTPNTGYCYVIVAHNETDSTWITDNPPTYPSPYWKSTTLCAPEGMVMDDDICGEITAKWTKAANSDGYNIYRALTGSGCDSLISSGCELSGHLAEGLDYDADNDATNDLIAQWKMNEASWNGSNKEVKDSSGQTPLNDGTAACQGVDCVVPTTTATNAKFDRAGDFGGDDYVEAQSKVNIEITGDITIEAWAKGSVNGATQGIVSKAIYNGGGANRQGWQLYKHSTTNKFAFQPFIDGVGTVIYSNSAYTDTNWHHLAVVRDSSTFYLYIDGEQQTQTTTDGFTESDDLLIIGRNFADYDGEYFTGLIDNVAIYNVTKSAEQIKIDYDAGDCGGTGCGLADICHTAGEADGKCGIESGDPNFNTDTCCYIDKRIIPYITYYYRVTATGEAGESPASDYGSGQTICFPPPEEEEE